MANKLDKLCENSLKLYTEMVFVLYKSFQESGFDEISAFKLTLAQISGDNIVTKVLGKFQDLD